MAPRLLIAPDKFKGSLTALGAAEAIARGITVACPDAKLALMPIWTLPKARIKRFTISLLLFRINTALVSGNQVQVLSTR